MSVETEKCGGKHKFMGTGFESDFMTWDKPVTLPGPTCWLSDSKTHKGFGHQPSANEHKVPSIGSDI